MSFSDRIGKTKPKTLLQVDAMDDDLRNGLWEACIEHYLRHSRVQYELDAPFQDLIRGLYVNFFKRPTDTIPDGSYRNIGAIRDWFFKANWFDVYNFIEYLLQKDAGNFSKRISFFLEREKSAYRVINRQLVPITEPIEIAAVSAATLVPERFAGARVLMQTAIQLYSQKPEPDYRNAVKEALARLKRWQK